MTVAKRGAGCGGRGSAVMRFGAWANGAQALRSLGGEGRLRTAKSRGPDARNAGVKSAELSAGDGVKKLRFTRESAIYAVEPLRGEGRSVSAEPVCSCAFPFDAHCTRDRGCGAHPVFPAPSLEESANDLQNSGECLSRECGPTSRRPRERGDPSVNAIAFIAAARSLGIAMRLTSSFPTNARGYGSPRSRGRRWWCLKTEPLTPAPAAYCGCLRRLAAGAASTTLSTSSRQLRISTASTG